MALSVLPTFNDTGSLGYPSRRVFLAGNGEAELKPTTFSSVLLFRVFLFLLLLPFRTFFSWVLPGWMSFFRCSYPPQFFRSALLVS